MTAKFLFNKTILSKTDNEQEIDDLTEQNKEFQLQNNIEIKEKLK